MSRTIMTGTATAQHVKILFRLEQDEDGYPPASAETLWAIRVDEDLYKLDNIPFFATGIAVDDIVLAKSVSWDELKRVLDTGREQERWDYEEACLARS